MYINLHNNLLQIEANIGKLKEEVEYLNLLP